MNFSIKSILFLFITILGLILVARTGQTAAPPPSDPIRIIAPPNLLNTRQAGVTLWHDYGAYALYKIERTTLNSLSTQTRDQIVIPSSFDQIQLETYAIDTTSPLDIPDNQRYSDLQESSLQLVQFVGPIKDEWLRQLESIGARPVHAIPTHAYLVWVDQRGREALDNLASEKNFLQYSEPYHPFFKFSPTLQNEAANQSTAPLAVTIQIVSHDNSQTTKETITGLLATQQSDWVSILGYENIQGTVTASDLETIAQLTDVYWIGRQETYEPLDEVQGQILAGNLDGTQSGPSGTGYLTWLTGRGFSTDPADYPVVNVTDDGLGNGTINSGDYTLHQLGVITNTTRVSFVSNCTNQATGESIEGHGHINVNIIGGYDPNDGAGFPFEGPNSYLRGMGINPYTPLSSIRVFYNNGSSDVYDVSGCSGTDTGVIQVTQDNGALISSNSWGCRNCAGSYTTASQAYDVGVRDADLSEAGNQELMFIFAAGNTGNNQIGTPGNGKNVLTVGASESDRPSDEDGTWADGCGISSLSANNAMDIASFSSYGPAVGGRIKPETIAPGTHIQGTASTSSGYNGDGICDQYRPSGQTIFAASSGTSHSTPAVAGVASLVYYWLENVQSVIDAGLSYTPSPAATKAYILNHPTYLTGVSANDTLPSNHQGYGMPNMGLMFDDTDKIVLDQTYLFDNSGEQWTWSGRVADPTKPVRLMLVYTDAAGAVGTSPQVNDLNLSLLNGGNTYLGNQFSGAWSITGGTADTANNYEAVFLPSGTNGSLEITVTAFNIAGDGVPNTGDGTDQDFALVCYNCNQGSGIEVTAEPLSRNICAPDDAIFDIDVASVLGYSDTVNLTTPNAPAGATAAFAPTSGLVPYTSTLTIGNTGSVTVGNYELDLVGTGPTTTYTTTVGLNLFTAVPSVPALTSPADGATGISLQPTLSWSASSQPLSYTVEIATDSGFSTIVYSETVGTATSHTVPNSLTIDQTHYWRVRADNSCGPSGDSVIYSFVTQRIYCTAPALDIEIEDEQTITSDLTITDFAIMSDLNLLVDITHSRIGDLDLKLTHQDSGTEISLLPASFICAGENIDVTFDDEGGAAYSCDALSDPALSGMVTPAEALTAFDYLESAGTWRLSVQDSFSSERGTLNQWCIQPATTADYGTLTGTITDLNTGLPLDSPNMTMDNGTNSFAIQADSTGVYTRTLPAGTYTVTAALNAYTTVAQGNVIVSNGLTTTQNIALPAGQTAHNGTGFSATLNLNETLTTSWTLSNTGTAAVNFQLLNEATGYAPELNGLLAGEDILIVNDGGFNTTAVTAFETAVGNLGYTFATLNSSVFDDMTETQMLAYQGIIYAGVANSGAEHNKIIEYLDAGGRFLIADNDLGYHSKETAFYEDYLQAVYVSDNGADAVLTGTNIMSGIDPDITADPYPDDFTLNTLGTGLLQAPNGNWAGSRVARNNYKAIYFAWDYQNAGGSSTGDTIETTILEKALNWLLLDEDLWFRATPDLASFAIGEQIPVTVTFNSNFVTVPGIYYGQFTVEDDDPYTDQIVPVTLTVNCGTCGQLVGTITDSLTADPISATMRLTSTWGLDYTLTDIDQFDLSLVPAVYHLTTSATDYLTATDIFTVTNGMTTTADIQLMYNHIDCATPPTFTSFAYDGSAATLNFSANGDYTIWHSATPYTAVWSSPTDTLTNDNVWIDNTLISSVPNYYVAQDSDCGHPAGNSVWLGIFPFEITPGD